MEKPQEIIRFGTLSAIACLVNGSATLLLVHFNLRGAVGALVSVAIIVALIGWVLAGRSAIARMVTTIWLAFITGAALASYAIMLVQHRTASMSPTIHVLSLITIVANLFALYFLWTAASTAWLQNRADAS